MSDLVKALYVIFAASAVFFLSRIAADLHSIYRVMQQTLNLMRDVL